MDKKFWWSFVVSMAWAMMVIALFIALLSGCAMTEESLDKYRVDEANWLNCASIYKQQGKPTYHEHIHERAGKWEIRSDLHMNDCRRIVGDEWLEY